MDARIATDLFEDSDSVKNDANLEPEFNEDDLNRMDETIKSISRHLRKGDWTYLGRHPEIRAIIRVIITEAIKEKPTNIFSFAASIFNPKNHKKLTKKINKQLKWVNKQVRDGAWSPANGNVLFPESSSSSFEGKKPTCEKRRFENRPGESDEMIRVQNMCPENFKPSC